MSNGIGVGVGVGVGVVALLFLFLFSPSSFVLWPLGEGELPAMKTDLLLWNGTQESYEVDVHIGPLGFIAIITPSELWKQRRREEDKREEKREEEKREEEKREGEKREEEKREEEKREEEKREEEREEKKEKKEERRKRRKKKEERERREGKDLQKLQFFCEKYHQWLLRMVREYGGVVFRGFEIENVYDFDDLLPFIDPFIQDELYLGTSPRNRLNDTKYVSTASEFPPAMVIPEHLEMSFKPFPPKQIFFFADQPNSPPGGQTPLSDFRNVWEDLSPDVQNRFKKNGIKYIRCYYSRNRFNIDPLRTKSWQDMFSTDDKEEAVEKAKEEGFSSFWESDDLCLTNVAESPTRIHEITGEEYWGNHLHVLHGSTFTIPIGWAAQIQQAWTTLFRYYMFNTYFFFRSLIGFSFGHDVVAENGEPLPFEDVLVVRKAIAQNSWIYPHQKGDVIWLDNQRIAHGRQPWFSGGRKIYVAWD